MVARLSLFCRRQVPSPRLCYPHTRDLKRAPPATTRWLRTHASPTRISSTVKPCASMIASEQLVAAGGAQFERAAAVGAWDGGGVAALGEDSTAGRPKGVVGRDAVPGGAVADRRVPRTGWSYSPISRMRVETHC